MVSVVALSGLAAVGKSHLRVEQFFFKDCEKHYSGLFRAVSDWPSR
jgi:hypothetical protein